MKFNYSHYICRHKYKQGQNRRTMELPNITIHQLRKSGLEFGFCYQDKLLVTNQVEAIERFRHPCRINAITTLICISGEAECMVNLNHYHVQKDMIAVCFPDDVIQIKASEHLNAYAVLISSNLLNELGLDSNRRSDFYLRIRQNAVCCLAQEYVVALKPYYALLCDNILNNTDETTEIIKGLLRAFAYSIISNMRQFQPCSTDDATSKRSGRNKLLFNDFMALVKQYHTSHRGVKFYAEKLCLTPNYLSGAIKEYTGKTATDWVNDFVILEAKIMLKDSNISIQEISYRLNFADQSTFGKYFKQLVGMSPKQYRNGFTALPPSA